MSRLCTMSRGVHHVTWCAPHGAHHVYHSLRLSYHDTWVPALNSFYMKFSADPSPDLDIGQRSGHA